MFIMPMMIGRIRGVVGEVFWLAPLNLCVAVMKFYVSIAVWLATLYHQTQFIVIEENLW
jgi:hypothetical protein